MPANLEDVARAHIRHTCGMSLAWDSLISVTLNQWETMYLSKCLDLTSNTFVAVRATTREQTHEMVLNYERINSFGSDHLNRFLGMDTYSETPRVQRSVWEYLDGVDCDVLMAGADALTVCGGAGQTPRRDVVSLNRRSVQEREWVLWEVATGVMEALV